MESEIDFEMSPLFDEGFFSDLMEFYVLFFFEDMENKKSGVKQRGD